MHPIEHGDVIPASYVSLPEGTFQVFEMAVLKNHVGHCCVPWCVCIKL